MLTSLTGGVKKMGTAYIGLETNEREPRVAGALLVPVSPPIA